MAQRAPGRPSRARPHILSAATELFLEQGLEVSLDTIAVAAGTTRQTLYNHFPGKAALLGEVFEHLKADMEAPLEEIEGARLPLDQLLHRLGHAVHHHFYGERIVRFQRLLIMALMNMPELLDGRRRIGSVRKSLAGILAQEDARGRVQIDHPDDAADAFLGAVMGSMYPSVLLGAPAPDADRLARLNREACRTFLLAWGWKGAGVPAAGQEERP